MKKVSVFCLLFYFFVIGKTFAANSGGSVLDQIGSGQDRLMNWRLYQQARGWLSTPVAQ